MLSAKNYSVGMLRFPPNREKRLPLLMAASYLFSHSEVEMI